MNPEDLKQLKEVELEILDEFLRICEKHQLRYLLMGGTCLGAIRHQGFIPWDDDIDIGMPREDYDKFAEIAKTELSDTFFLQNYWTDPLCGLIFMKIRKNGTTFSSVEAHHLPIHQGIWIDIFCYDNLPDDSKIQKRTFSKTQLLRKFYAIKCGYKLPSTRSKSMLPAYWLAKFMTLFMPLNWLINTMDKACKKENSPSNPFVVPYGCSYGLGREIFPRDMIMNYADVQFEGRTCKTFKEYDRYLTSIYGDYMQLPPEDQRKTVHDVYELKF